MTTLSSRPFCSYDSRQVGLWYLPARWRDTTPHSSIVLSRRTVRTWQGWHHHMALSLIAVWFLIGETHRGQQMTPALTFPQVRYGLSVLLLEVFCTPSIDYICREVHRQ